MAAHTPGPFSAKGKYVFAGRDCIAICDTDNAPEERMEANARLFAAAPDMLETLKGVVRVLPRFQMARMLSASEIAALEEARAAIAKAEGK